MRCKKISLLLLITVSAVQAFSQSLQKEKLDQYTRILETNDKLMGRVLVFQNGETIYSQSLGFSNISEAIKPDSNTLYRIGSISKTITATLILQLAEAGKLDISASIKAFFPSIKNADQIKISDLLNHHSGIHNFTGGNFMSWNTKPVNRHDLLDSIAKGGSDFAPGTKASYSNSNYVLLSFILEDIYHQSYATILNDKIITPLHLKHFQFGDKLIPEKNKAVPYYFEAGWNVATETNLSIPMGAGGILSSPEDLAKLINALFEGKIISQQMLGKMTTQSDGFGYGLFEKNMLGKTVYTHDGAIDGFNSFFYYFPENKTTYILFSNAENCQLETVNNSFLSIIFNKPFDLPEYKLYTTTPKELEQYTGTYTNKTNPLIIEISGKNNFLLAQPRGQKIYTMQAIDKNMFFHEKTGVTLTFNPSENQMTMKQGNQTVIFIKQ